MRLFLPATVAALIAATSSVSWAQSPAAETPPAVENGDSQSLFGETWRQVEAGGRWSSVDGDPARFQRYEDIRDGFLLDKVRWATQRDTWLFQFGADNVGWRDQRYRATYERAGRFSVTGLWDEIPQFYSIDTRTPYTSSSPGVLLLDDGTQLAIQSGTANLNAYVPMAPQFDLRERRDIGRVDLKTAVSQQIDLSARFITTKHSGELPWGASFGFSNDVEVALPYDSRTNDFSLGAEWNNNKAMLRIAYDGSWFDNQSDTLIWDSPLRLTDTTSAPGRGRMALWPSNSSNTVSGGGFYKFAGRSQATASVSYGVLSNNEPLQDFTINPALPQLGLPRTTTEAEAHVFTTNVGVVSRPTRDWRFSGRVRTLDYDNKTPETDIPQFVNYDTSVTTSSTGGPHRYAHGRNDITLDATWSGLRPLAITGGYARTDSRYDFRIFEDTAENAFYVSADAVSSQWVTFRARYDQGTRNGSGFDESRLTEIGEQPGLRHYDLADRKRKRLTGTVDVMPLEYLTLSASTGLGKEDFDDSEFGLQETDVRTFTLSVDVARTGGWGGGASYDYERYTGLQESRSASPGAQAEDPLRNWTTDSRERVNYFLVYLTPPRFGNTETRLSYEYAHSRGNYVYGVVPGGPLPEPSQLPEVFNKLQDLRLDVRHRLTSKLAATFAYRYEPFRVYDFAFDPSVVDGIVQPSSLVLGYVYRPYTAHSFVAGVRYLF
jgi:MtrB/PioB family decaheme-associated outer membrane protein